MAQMTTFSKKDLSDEGSDLTLYYRKLCDDQMLSFTKDSGCQLLQGLSYQKFFFANGKVLHHIGQV